MYGQSFFSFQEHAMRETATHQQLRALHIELSADDHRRLKMAVAEAGVLMRVFVRDAVMEVVNRKMELYERRALVK